MIDLAPLDRTLAPAPIEAPRIEKGASRAEIRKAAENFESAFISELIGRMFETVDTEGAFGGGHGEEMMRSFMHEEWSKSIAANGGIGLADNVYAELLRLQEGMGNADRSA